MASRRPVVTGEPLIGAHGVEAGARTEDSHAHITPILATKLFVPHLRAAIVPRPRLLTKLDAGRSAALTLVSAPAGWGKTTALVEWLDGAVKPPDLRSSSGGRLADGPAVDVAWLSLEPSDNEPYHLLRYIVAALQTVVPTAGAAIPDLLTLRPPPPMAELLTLLVNDLATLERPCILVLDDYHALTAPSIHEAIGFLLEHRPPQLSPVITTREDPPLPLARLRARGQLCELRAVDLRFTDTETHAFLREAMGLGVSEAEAMALEARTEGWIAGLQLAALALRNRPDPSAFIATFSGDNRFVVDYLVTEVLVGLPDHLRRFVLQTSILERLSGPLCDAVVLGAHGDGDGSYSQRILDDVEQRNLFLIPLDDTRGWYRYHHLFAQVMRAQLAGGAARADTAELHARASRWLEQNGFVDDAIDHALAAHDFERAARLIEALALATTRHRQHTIEGWLSALPADLRSGRPRLLLAQAYVALGMTAFHALEPYLQQAEALLQTVSAAEATSLEGEIAALRAIVFGMLDDPRAIDAGRRALARISAAHPLRATIAMALGYAYFARGQLIPAEQTLTGALTSLPPGRSSLANRIVLLAILAMVRRAQGRLHAAVALCYEALQLVGQFAGPLPATSRLLPLPVLGIVLYEQNDLAAAEHHLTHCIEASRQSGTIALLVTAQLYLAQVLEARGDLAGALTLVEAAETAAHANSLPASALREIEGSRVLIWLKQGKRRDAVVWAEAQPVPARRLPSLTVYDYPRFALVQTRMAQGRWNEARSMLAGLLQAAEETGHGLLVVGTLCLQALAARAGGDVPGARAALERALALAEMEGYVRVFVDEGARMAALLSEISRGNSLVGGYTRRLLSAFPDAAIDRRARVATMPGRPGFTDHVPAAGPRVLDEPLSNRELEILRLIAAGHSNGAIADRLVVAVSTVKKHINNLYAKLEVESRTQALLRARELDLL